MGNHGEQVRPRRPRWSSQQSQAQDRGAHADSHTCSARKMLIQFTCLWRKAELRCVWNRHACSSRYRMAISRTHEHCLCGLSLHHEKAECRRARCWRAECRSVQPMLTGTVSLLDGDKGSLHNNTLSPEGQEQLRPTS